MKSQDFINLLKSYSPNDQVKFYCPVNQTYYHIYAIDPKINTICIITNTDIATSYSYSRLINILNSFNLNEKIKFIHPDKEFMIS
jgi:hypothetical protein